MTDIWYTRMDNITGDLVNQYYETLSPEMQQEVLRYKQESDRKSRVLARRTVNLYLEQGVGAGTKMKFLLGENKKPYLPEGPCFNISHSGNYVMVGFSEHPVGVDIEEKREIEWKLIASHFHEAEQEYINRDENRADRFYRVWARKEAYLKANGVGILKGLKTVNALEDLIIDEKGAWHLYDVEIDKGYASAVCTPVPPAKHAIQFKNINSLLTISHAKEN